MANVKVRATLSLNVKSNGLFYIERGLKICTWLLQTTLKQKGKVIY